MHDLDKNIFQKIELFVLGELDETEHKLVLDSILHSKASRDYYNQLLAIIKSEGYTRNSHVFNKTKSFERVDKRILLSDKETVINYRFWFRIAATLLIIVSFVLSYFVFQHYSKNNDEYVAINVVEAPLGSIAKLILPDNTRVTLNAGSAIQYPVHYTNAVEREVTLNGEAFFDVAENKESPFIVKAKGFNIKALGTSFNVKAYEDEKTVEATLVDGIIEIQKEGDEKNIVTLAPNQKASIFPDIKKTGTDALIEMRQDENMQVIDKNILLQKNINPLLYISWKDEQLVIQKQSLGDLAKVLERKFNVEFRFESESLKEFVFSGRFTNETLELVLEALKLTAPVKFEIQKGVVIIMEDRTKKREYQRYLRED